MVPRNSVGHKQSGPLHPVPGPRVFNLGVHENLPSRPATTRAADQTYQESIRPSSLTTSTHHGRGESITRLSRCRKASFVPGMPEQTTRWVFGRCGNNSRHGCIATFSPLSRAASTAVTVDHGNQDPSHTQKTIYSGIFTEHIWF